MKKQHYEAILEGSKVPIFIDPSLAPPPIRQSIPGGSWSHKIIWETAKWNMLCA